jgi:26S proteasome non-ATPase regulatory subunit 10
VEALLHTGADVYVVNYGEHTLHYVVRKGWVKIAQVLISNDANIKLKDELGYTPLHQEARQGNP